MGDFSHHAPLVSVIVLNWKGKELTAGCLASLRAQTFCRKEIILVDNGSGDGSVEFLGKGFPEVVVIALPKNLGFTGGNNAGIRKARGKYVALLNNDAQADPNWLKELVLAMDMYPRVGMCASKIVLHDRPHLLDAAGDRFTIAGAGGKRGHLDSAQKLEYNCLKKVFGACAAAALYRRSMLEDIGLFDEDFFIAQEDVDLSFRAQLKGYQCLYVPTAVVHHRLNASIRTYSREYVYYGHRNLEYVYLKNMPLPWLLLTLPLHLMDVGLSSLFFLAKGRGFSFLRAKWDALRALPGVLRKRRRIQAQRTISLGQLWALLEKHWLTTKLANAKRKL